MKIFITGVSGLIGKALALSLQKKGHEVWGSVRKTGHVHFLPASQILTWDGISLLDEKVLSKMNAIIHLAGEPVAGGRWTEARKKAILDSRVKSTQALGETLARLKPESRPEVVVSASAIGIYGDRAEEVLTEDSAPASPPDFLSQVTEAWEQEAQKLQSAETRLVVIRTGIVLAREGGALAEDEAPRAIGERAAVDELDSSRR